MRKVPLACVFTFLVSCSAGTSDARNRDSSTATVADRLILPQGVGVCATYVGSGVYHYRTSGAFFGSRECFDFVVDYLVLDEQEGATEFLRVIRATGELAKRLERAISVDFVSVNESTGKVKWLTRFPRKGRYALSIPLVPPLCASLESSSLYGLEREDDPGDHHLKDKIYGDTVVVHCEPRIGQTGNEEQGIDRRVKVSSAEIEFAVGEWLARSYASEFEVELNGAIQRDFVRMNRDSVIRVPNLTSVAQFQRRYSDLRDIVNEVAISPTTTRAALERWSQEATPLERLIACCIQAESEFEIAAVEKNEPIARHQVDWVGREMPSLDLINLDGSPWSSNAAHVGVRIFTFGGLSCPPCCREEIALQEIAAANSKRRIEVVSVNTYGDSSEAITRFAERWKLRHRFVCDPGRTISKYFPLEAVPLTIIVDGKGSIAKVITGFDETIREEIAATVETLLGSSSATEPDMRR